MSDDLIPGVSLTHTPEPAEPEDKMDWGGCLLIFLGVVAFWVIVIDWLFA